VGHDLGQAYGHGVELDLSGRRFPAATVFPGGSLAAVLGMSMCLAETR
jgi:hypothetical protein